MKLRWACACVAAVLLAAALVTGLERRAEASDAAAPQVVRLVAPPPAGLDAGNCTASPCATLTYALGKSASGDSLQVATGTYNEHITLKDGVSIYGQGWDKTVINGNYSGLTSTVMVPASVGASTILSGVQVTGGGNGNPNAAFAPYGGGLHIYGSPTVVNTWVYSNTANYGGGVLTESGSAPTLNNVAVWNNRARYGGGVYVLGGNLTMMGDFNGTNGTVFWNSAEFDGGGFRVGNASATLTGLRIWWNSARLNGAGVAIADSQSPNHVTLLLDDVRDNHTLSAGAGGGGVVAFLASDVQILYNLFDSNTASFGGAILLSRSVGRVQGNLLLRNRSTGSPSGSSGGAIDVTGSSLGVAVEGNWIEGNYASATGGGVGIDNQAVVTLNANTVVSNSAASAGGIFISHAGAVTVSNNLIARNSAGVTEAGGLRIVSTAARVVNNTLAQNVGDGVRFDSANGIVLVNNITAGNSGFGIQDLSTPLGAYTADYNDTYLNANSNIVAGAHDLSLDPAFKKSGDVFQYYHLLSASPLAAAGSPVWAPPFDIDGEARTGFISIGADQIVRRLFLPLVRK